MSHSTTEASARPSVSPAHSPASSHARLFIIAWMFTTVFYLLEYMVRSAPAGPGSGRLGFAEPEMARWLGEAGLVREVKAGGDNCINLDLN